MTQRARSSGYFRHGLPYVRAGRGPEPLVVFQGLLFENKPQAGMLFGYGFLKRHYTLYSVLRVPGLRQGCSLSDMADDYAEMIREEFGRPVDVIGVSTGGAIAQHFAADHPELLRRLVIHSSAHTLGDAGKQVQLEIARLVRSGRVREAQEAMGRFLLPRTGIWRLLSPPMVWAMGRAMSIGTGPDLSDLLTTIDAEDVHDFSERLSEISAPTLVVGGLDDPFYSSSLFRETAAGIPDARLRLYEKTRHPANGREFRRDVLEFLRDR